MAAVYRSLGALRSELLARLGMGAMGASGGANGMLVDSFLRNGQEQLYELQDWRHLTDYFEITTGVDQNLYDYPITGTMQTQGCAQSQRILRIETEVNNLWTKIDEGITTGMWSTMDTRSQPARYDRYAQILVYPKADAAYTMRVWFVADLARFTEDNDRCSIPDSMVLLHALANAKAHYRQPDATVYQGQLNTLLSQLRGRSFSQNGVYRRGPGAPAEPKPAVVGRDVP